jgi:hypothetical protein
VAILYPASFWRYVAIYFLFEMFSYRFKTVLLENLTGPPVSVERSLLLFILNALEVTLAFALFYRLAGIPTATTAMDAINQSISVFGTLDSPKDASGKAVATGIVAIQLILDFLLVAIFLSVIIGRMQSQDPRGPSAAGNTG